MSYLLLAFAAFAAVSGLTYMVQTMLMYASIYSKNGRLTALKSGALFGRSGIAALELFIAATLIGQAFALGWW